MRIGVKRKATGNVVRAKIRKEKNQALRQKNEIREAEQLGITVFELRQSKFAEVRSIIKKQEELQERERLARSYDPYSQGRGYGFYPARRSPW